MEKRRRLLIFLFATALIANVVRASTKSESFLTRGNLDTSELVWNIGRSELHPPLRVVGWDSGGGPSSTAYDVGDGSDGAFVQSSYARFSKNGDLSGNIIRLDTDQFAELNVTYFVLVAGWTLRPVGSNPLAIRSQTSVTIDGDVDCSGDAGTAAQADFSVSVLGGSARCGGGRGGDSLIVGGTPSAANDGASGGAGTLGGGVGPAATLVGGQGGGGGGAYIKTYVAGPDKDDPTSGFDALAASAGNVGTIDRDDEFLVVDGAGSGGGGGSAYDGAVDAQDSSGASGGAGGGNIQIYAVEDITVNGSVFADGGDGGSDLARAGGAGGGGGGGSILMLAGGDIQNNGTIRAENGAAGTSALGGLGGRGAWGRTWIVEKDGYASGNFEDPETQLNVPGAVMYQLGTFHVYSSAIDFRNTKPKLNSSAMTVDGSGTATLELSFSAEAADATFPAYAAAASFDGLEVERYMKFHLQVTNTGMSTNPLPADKPIRITGLEWDYTGKQTDQFDFSTGCGGSQSSSMTSYSRASGNPILALMLFLCPLLFWWHQRRK